MNLDIKDVDLTDEDFKETQEYEDTDNSTYVYFRNLFANVEEGKDIDVPNLASPTFQSPTQIIINNTCYPVLLDNQCYSSEDNITSNPSPFCVMDLDLAIKMGLKITKSPYGPFTKSETDKDNKHFQGILLGDGSLLPRIGKLAYPLSFRTLFLNTTLPHMDFNIKFEVIKGLATPLY